MTPEDKEQLIFEALVATAKKVTELDSNLQQSNRKIDELTTQLRSKENDIDDLCQSINMTRLDRSEKEAEKHFPKHENVWEHRVLKAILHINPASRAEATRAAIETNKEVRRQLREYLDNYYVRKKAIHFSDSQKKATLVEFAKLTLQADPLITWKQLNDRLEKAERTINDIPDGGELYVQRAAKRLFENIDIHSHTLWREESDRPDYVLHPYDYYEVTGEYGETYYVKYTDASYDW